MKARHIYYAFAALVLSGHPYFFFQFGEDGPDGPPFWDWVLSWHGLWAFSFVVSTFSTGYLVSRLGSTRAVRIAGLAAMPLASLALFFFPLARWVLLPFAVILPHQVSLYSMTLTYPMLAAVLCWLVAPAKHATPAALGEAADA